MIVPTDQKTGKSKSGGQTVEHNNLFTEGVIGVVGEVNRLLCSTARISETTKNQANILVFLCLSLLLPSSCYLCRELLAHHLLGGVHTVLVVESLYPTLPSAHIKRIYLLSGDIRWYHDIE